MKCSLGGFGDCFVGVASVVMWEGEEVKGRDAEMQGEVE